MTSPAELRTFFSYYGGKWRAAPRYPAPAHDTIIEPFAGSAGYALRYPHLKVHLYDVDPVVAGVWDYLIGVSPDEILRLPAQVDHVDDLDLPDEAKHLIGFWLNKGMTHPCKVPSAWLRAGIRPHSAWGETIRARIASQVPYIRHWTITNGSFVDAPDVPATWFVDPPYKSRVGQRYRCSKVDFEALAAWCQSRRGQVIVCEQDGADWLPFQPFGEMKSTRGYSKEVVWMNETAPQVKHPAKFSDPILDVMADVLRDHEVEGIVLDPFAGVGKVHRLPAMYPRILTVGVELEQEWADQHPATICGSCMDLAAHGFSPGEVAAIVTSPAYGNRMADKHNPSPSDTSTRHTYKHYLGRDLTDGSSAGLQWGPAYRSFHKAAWTEILRVLEPGGLFVLNISDHVRHHKVVPVTAWHKATLRGLGVEWIEEHPIATRRQKHGANANARVECEWVLVGRKK